MKKQTVVRLICFLLSVLLMAGMIVSCRDRAENNGEESSETEAAVIKKLLAGNRASEYVIVVNMTNSVEKGFAMNLQTALFTMTGVMLPLRGIDLEPVECEILVGNTGRQESLALAARMGEKDFAWQVTDGGRVVLCATDKAMYAKLENVLPQTLFADLKDKTLQITLSASYVFSVDGSDAFGASLKLLEGGKTEFVLVYDVDGSYARQAANAAASYIEGVSGVRFSVKSDKSEYEHEILLGTPDRAAATAVKKQIAGERGYAICVEGDRLVICANDNISFVHALYRFAEMLKESQGDLTLYQSDNILSYFEDNAYPVNVDTCVTLYQEMYSTYSSYIAFRYDNLSASDAADQALIEALITRMGNSVALYAGSSTALHQGYFVKLDTKDYSKVTQIQNGHVYIAKEFADRYFGKDLTANAEGYVDLTAYCEGDGAHRIFVDEGGKLAVLSPVGEASFANPGEKIGDYTNGAYLEKMEGFFTDPTRREPSNETEQSRVVIEETLYDPTGVYDYTLNSYKTNYSPGICITQENGKEVIYVSYESCMVTNFATETGNVTYLKRSADGGATWTQVGEVAGMRWASVFAHNGKIYLLGTHLQGSLAMVGEYDPATNAFRYENLGVKGGLGAPNPVLIANGRVYKASGPSVMSAPADADLLSASSWSFSTMTATQLLSKSWFLNASGMTDCGDYALGEGSMVVGPDGEIYMILRIDANPAYGYAAIVHVSQDGVTLSRVSSCNSLIRIPTTPSKFSVVYDGETGLYLAMTSVPTLGIAGQRNILGLCASRDMINWTLVDTLLVDREMMNSTLSAYAHAFQYVDFDLSGDSLRLVVREATGYTNTYHDGKYITMYTVENFRDLIAERAPELLQA